MNVLTLFYAELTTPNYLASLKNALLPIVSLTTLSCTETVVALSPPFQYILIILILIGHYVAYITMCKTSVHFVPWFFKFSD